MIENISVKNEVFGLRLIIRKYGEWSEAIWLRLREEERREYKRLSNKMIEK